MDIYSLEDRTVDHIIDLVDAEMTAGKQPKVLLFDIGGVCVSRQSLLTYQVVRGPPIADCSPGQITVPGHPRL